jgi:ComF family protein
VAEGPTERATCPKCHQFRLQFDATWPLGAYEGELREAVLRTKRLAHESLSVALGQLLAQRRSAELARFQPDVVVPIPMHWWRRTLRGVNSPEILAEQIGRRLGCSVRRRALVRCRSTRPQKDLSPHERFSNVRGAFRLRRGRPDRWQGSHVLLVDDILTTGATCSEAAGVFKRAGAAVVAVVVLARA